MVSYGAGGRANVSPSRIRGAECAGGGLWARAGRSVRLGEVAAAFTFAADGRFSPRTVDALEMNVTGRGHVFWVVIQNKAKVGKREAVGRRGGASSRVQDLHPPGAGSLPPALTANAGPSSFGDDFKGVSLRRRRKELFRNVPEHFSRWMALLPGSLACKGCGHRGRNGGAEWSTFILFLPAPPFVQTTLNVKFVLCSSNQNSSHCRCVVLRSAESDWTEGTDVRGLDGAQGEVHQLQGAGPGRGQHGPLPVFRSCPRPSVTPGPPLPGAAL